LKGADGTIVNGEFMVRDDKVWIDLDDTAKSTAARAGTDGGIK